MTLHIFHGFCMAVADSVPGVSGGTIAFILGFYERFIEALRDLFGADGKKRKSAFLYLCKLGVGWGCGLLGAVALLSALFEKNIYYMSSLFLGLSLAAIPFIILSEKSTLKGKYHYLLFSMAGFFLVAGIALLRTSGLHPLTINFQSYDLLTLGYFAASGFLAITAMVLPGISGSTLLLILGVYMPLIHAVHALMRFDLSVLPGILAVGTGILLGVIFSIRGIRAALRKYRPQCIYLIIGMVVGSLVAIAFGPTTLNIPQAPLSLDTFHFSGFVIGILILFVLEAVSSIRRKSLRKA